MSGSPKYVWFSIQGSILRELEMARERKRRAEERRLREARVKAGFAALSKAWANLDRGQSEKFDRAGFTALKKVLAEIGAAIEKKDFSEAERAVKKGEELLLGHQRAVAGQKAAWLAEKKLAEEKVAELEDMLVAYTADPVIAYWCGEDLSAVRENLFRSRELARREDFAGAAQMAREGIKKAEAAREKAWGLQDQEKARQIVINGLNEVMRRMGFVVGEPVYAEPGKPTASVLLSGYLPSGRSLLAAVELQGKISYQVNGYPLEEERSSDGRRWRTCAEAEKQLEEIHRELKNAFAVETSEIFWEGKNPERIRRGARILPSGGRVDVKKF